MGTLILKISTVVAYAIMVTVNYLAIALPLGGRETGAISDIYPSLFTPAGYTFSIWGIIYILLGIYVFYQVTRKEDSSLTSRANRIFIINALLNAAWLFAWHYNLIWLSLLIMIALLVTLIYIANILRANILTKEENWTIRLPFSVYFGWITVATIANATILLVSLGWDGFGLPDSAWMVAILLIGTAIGSWRTIYDQSIPYGLVLVWAYGGILTKHLSPAHHDSQYPIVIAVVALCIIVFKAVMLFVHVNKKRLSYARSN